MAARAVWKGELKIGTAAVPVKLYAAVQDRDIHFHVLQKQTSSRVKQQMITERRAKVENQRVRKGYEIEPGTFVIVKWKILRRRAASRRRIPRIAQAPVCRRSLILA